MNRLKNHTCYLAGSMDDGRAEGKVWREVVGDFLRARGVKVLNPYFKPLRKDTHSSELLEDDKNYEEVIRCLKAEDYDEVARRFKQVRAVDLRQVDKADFLVAYLDFSKIMTGTMEEIFTANRQRKPVIILTSKPKKEMPPWYFGSFPHRVFFESVEEVKQYLTGIDEDEQIDLLGNRWVFWEIE
jgi:nucleoside 2-deoxyribosyltransferase